MNSEHLDAPTDDISITSELARRPTHPPDLAAKSLGRTERELADLFESAPLGIHWASPDGTILQANRAELDMLGYAREEYVGHNVAEFHADTDMVENLLDRLRAGEVAHNVEARLRCKDGSLRHVLINANGLWEEGRLAHTRCFTQDITNRKQAEEARARLVAVESCEDAVVGKTLDGTICSWNAGAEQLFGYMADEAIGRPVTLIIPPERHNEERDLLDRLRRGELVEHYETIRMSKAGRRIDVLLTISPVRGDSGHIIGASEVVRDVTSHKSAERALREADRRKNEFVAVLAHELRNPLAPIRNALQIMQLGDPGATARAREVVDRQLQQLVRLVDDLLDVSRITSGKLVLQPERVNLATVVRTAVETSQPLIEKAGHHLTVTLPTEPVYLNADPPRLAQVFANLLNNAAKYTERGGRICLTAKRQAGGVVVAVADTGVGIPVEMLPRVFEMFAQATSSLDRAQGGLGVGLTLAQRLVEMHGGTIEAHSEGPGRGSQFQVWLPVAKAVGAVTPAENGHPPAAPEGGPACRVLVVDDNQDAADSLGLMLSLMGHKVSYAYDGLGAVEAARVFRPDVVICDIGLPGIDGYEVARRLRAEPQMASSILAALTGWGQEEDRRHAHEAGFNAHLVKPVSQDAIWAILASAPRAKGATGSGD